MGGPDAVDYAHRDQMVCSSYHADQPAGGWRNFSTQRFDDEAQLGF